ncbi:MAG: hypothetical protein RI900_3050 [Actinomycetota bacterium]
MRYLAATDDHPDPLELNGVLPTVEVAYGEPAAFASGSALRFPDFELMYRGRAPAPGEELDTWVFRRRDAEGEHEVLITSGGALAEPGATWTVHGSHFDMNWVRTAGTPLREIVVVRRGSA